MLDLERKQDHLNYQQLQENASLSERRAAGLVWYPIAIRNSEIGRGDYLTLEVERTTNHDISHQLRFGASAVFFSNHDSRYDRLEGTISFQLGNTLKITLKVDELPDWSRMGKLGIELLFDSKSYEDMEKALKEAGRRHLIPEENQLIKVLTGENNAVFGTHTFFKANSLNDRQQNGLDKIIAAEQLAIIHGPPGTGKTTTLVHSINALCKLESKQILVIAPSNTAVDLLTEKLAEQGLDVIRLGNPARISPSLLALCLDSKIAAHPRMKDARDLKKKAKEFLNLAHKYKRNFGPAERQQRKALFDEAHRIMKEVSAIELFIQDDLLGKAQIITATPIGSNYYQFKERSFSTVVIDEAGQAIEPACWIPILKAKKVILAGDHMQLPPTVKSTDAAKKGLAISLLERCMQSQPEAVVALNEQYRMNRYIMSYPSRVFYQNSLIADPGVADRVIFPGDLPLLFVDTAGCGFDESLEGTSTINPGEAAFLIKHLGDYLSSVAKDTTENSNPSIAVISPYKGQVKVLDEYFKSSALKENSSSISINTIDSFQGQERDIVYISMTRSNPEGQIGFLSDIRRMNVALTRARKKLVIIGDSATISSLAFYSDLIVFAQKENLYHSAWDYTLD